MARDWSAPYDRLSGKVSLSKIRLNAGGYSSSPRGRYYGNVAGNPVWHADDETGESIANHPRITSFYR